MRRPDDVYLVDIVEVIPSVGRRREEYYLQSNVSRYKWMNRVLCAVTRVVCSLLVYDVSLLEIV